MPLFGKYMDMCRYKVFVFSCLCREYFEICAINWATCVCIIIENFLFPATIGGSSKYRLVYSRVLLSSRWWWFIYFVSLEDEGVPWKKDFCHERGLHSIWGGFVPYRAIIYRGRQIYVIKGDYSIRQFAIGGSCLQYQLFAVEGEFVLWMQISSLGSYCYRKRRIRVMGGGCLS